MSEETDNLPGAIAESAASLSAAPSAAPAAIPAVAIPNKTLEDNEIELYARYRSLQASPHTIARIRISLRRFIEYLHEHHRVFTAEALTLAHVHAYQAHLSQRVTKEGLPLKPASINTQVKAVRVFLDLIHEYGYITRPLARHLAYVREPHMLPRSVLNHVQVRQLIRRIDTGTPVGIRDRAMIELLYSSGIRIGELEGLALTDLDIEHAAARVVGKGRQERFVPIGRTALKWLTSYIRGVRPYFAQATGATAVFLSERGVPFPAHAVRHRIREYAAPLGLDFPVTPHTFRRSCTSEMIKGNANLYHVKQLLGHNSFETLDHYAKLDITDLQATLARCHPRERDE